jgi:hypothetical protein
MTEITWQGDQNGQDMKTIANNSFFEHIFEERAENLSKQELMTWSVETAQDRNIIKKLHGPGTKLLSGPRGSGKSTLLRKAYFRLLEAGKVLPVYVNYSQSLALEPLFHNHANALQIFRQWVLFKIIVGIGEAFDDAKKARHEGLDKYVHLATDFIEQLEQGYEPNLENNTIAPSILKTLIDEWALENGFQRSVLLFDDAAHAFSSLQQREFFEIFRNLKSRTISPKAAVYPGMTSYSPNFHLGHDAELIEAWYKPEEENYLDTMKELLQKRLSSDQIGLLDEKLIEYLALAAFGLPRSFLTMISELLGIEEESPKKPSRNLARQAILRNCSFLRGLFQSLSRKLPRYSHFVDMGRKLEVAIVRELKNYNKSRDNEEKTGLVGIVEPIELELGKILALLEYAGIVRFIDSVNWGQNKSYRRYFVHYALLIEKNALHLASSYPLSTLIMALTNQEFHHFRTTRGQRLLGKDFQEKCTLNLAPCQNCGAPRISDEAKFCVECGKPLSDVSVYEELLKAPIEQLPLPKKKIDLLKQQTSIKVVQDILLDEENQQIMQVKGIGPFWASRIRNAAEEFVSV